MHHPPRGQLAGPAGPESESKSETKSTSKSEELGHTAPGTRHLFVASRGDWVLRGVDISRLPATPAWRTVWVPDTPAGRAVSHAELPSDPGVIAAVLDELRR